ncbi:hypothetical protein [Mycobacteroides abscessus]|uniref:hypothetical protein n=1 Tax=Mycobacteroides abscessus TaxID=36809 RepID=UPI001F2A661B|nr:hypothetical protein [Mycobacteroides abscessus]
MAAPDLRIVRRPRSAAGKSLVAASAPVHNPAKTFRHQVAAGRAGWQNEAWDMLDSVGELRYYVGWRSAGCSRVHLIASELDDKGAPTGKCSNQRVNDIVNAMAGNQLGRSQLIKRAVECLSVPGEVWIAIIFREDSPPAGTWLALSRDEIKRTGREVSIELPTGEEYELNLAQDSIFRVWIPRPRRAKEADSPVRATMDSLHEIVRTTKKIRNADNSRLIGNGIVFVPNEMSLPYSNAPVGADKPAGSPDPGLALQGIPAVRELQELLFQVAKASFEDEDSFAAMIPIFASVSAEHIDKVQHLRFDSEITDTAIKTRNDAIARLAMGLEVSPERLLGLGSSTNHWSAWQIGDNDVQMHIAPVMETICQAINDQVFHKVLEREGVDPRKYVLWFDAGQLTADPDKSEDATNAFDRGTITAEAYRDFLNLGNTGYDFTTIDGWRLWAQDKVSQEPALITTLLPLLDNSVQAIDFPALNPGSDTDGGSDSADSGGDSSSTNEGNDPDTENKGPGYDQGKRGRKDSVGKEAGGIVELLVRRALELAAKRRRGRSRDELDRLRGIPMYRAHKVMEPVADADVAELIRGWDDILDDDFAAANGIDPEALRAEVNRQVQAQLTADVVDA